MTAVNESMVQPNGKHRASPFHDQCHYSTLCRTHILYINLLKLFPMPTPYYPANSAFSAVWAAILPLNYYGYGNILLYLKVSLKATHGFLF